MRIITSIAPTRIERQAYCIRTWLDHTPDIIACQAEHEIEPLRPHFPTLSFRSVGTSTSFSKSTPKITELIKQADVPSILMNSDISIKDDTLAAWKPEPKVLKVGIRHDYYANRSTKKYYQKYGIDAFLILPEMIPLIPDLDFCVGCPGWDFWLPYHLWSQHDYQIKVVQCSFLHEFHTIGWSTNDQDSYRERMTQNYKVTPMMLPYFILDITDRHKVKHVSVRR